MTPLTHTLIPLFACAQSLSNGALVSAPRSYSASRTVCVEKTPSTSLVEVQTLQAILVQSPGFTPDAQSTSLAEVGNLVFQGSRAMTREERSTFRMLMAKQSKRIR